MINPPPFAEHHVATAQGAICVRDYAGAEPAFVLMHGLPDNQGIYDALVPYLAAAGRRVVTFDFLGFGASDKPAGAAYGYAQQMANLEAVIDALALGPPALVPHDSSGFAALNFALDHPERVSSVCMLNSAYADTSGVTWPEMIELAAAPALRALSDAILQSPAQIGWVLGWQQAQFAAPLPLEERARFGAVIGKLIEANFTATPSALPAYAQMTAQFQAELARNAARLPQLGTLDLPVRLIWGELDPYLTIAMAEARLPHLRHGSLIRIAGGHWVQADAPEAVASALLA